MARAMTEQTGIVDMEKLLAGDGTVVSVHKKGYRIKFDQSGSTWARDKSYVCPLENVEASA